jgi:PHD/YefM family antitoxin component YafN of YafNO toxin-antitoxin module
MQQNTFSNVRTHFKDACDQVVNDQDILLVTRRDADNIIMMPQSHLRCLARNCLLIEIPCKCGCAC